MEDNGKTEEPRKVGRPLTWTSPDQLQALIDTYFNNSARPTLSGLAYTIGVDRKTLYNYEDKDEFFYTIKKARERIEQKYEELLIYSDKTNTVGVIFALKNTGWKDRSDITSDDKKIETNTIVFSDFKNGTESK